MNASACLERQHLSRLSEIQHPSYGLPVTRILYAQLDILSQRSSEHPARWYRTALVNAVPNTNEIPYCAVLVCACSNGTLQVTSMLGLTVGTDAATQGTGPASSSSAAEGGSTDVTPGEEFESWCAWVLNVLGRRFMSRA